MADNQRSWWQQWTDTTYIKPLNRLRAAQEPYRREEQVLINRRDITSRKDAWDMQEFITRMYVKQLLRHPASKVLLAVLLVVNAITIALRTNSMLGQKHYELFSTIDDIVLTTLICELLLGWLNGFWIFWKCRRYHLHPQGTLSAARVHGGGAPGPDHSRHPAVGARHGQHHGPHPLLHAGILRVWGHSLWCVRAHAFPEHAGCPVYPLHLHHPGWLGGHLQ